MSILQPTRALPARFRPAAVLLAQLALVVSLLAALVLGLTARRASGDEGSKGAGDSKDSKATAAEQSAGKNGKKKIVFIAGKPSHGFAQHEHNAGCLLLAKCLKEAMGDKIETKVYTSTAKEGGWPEDAHALDDADALVMFCDGGAGHMVIPHLKEVDALVKKGMGVGCIHYAVEVPKGEPGDKFLDWIGGYFEAYRSINPHWKATFTQFPKHPVANGVKPFSTNDEWYYHMRFRDGMKGVTSVLAAIPTPGLRGSDAAHNGNDEVHNPKGEPETVLWVSDDEGGARGFGCTGAHFHWNWAQDSFRKTVLNAIEWIAHVEVPEDGVQSTRPTVDDLLANQDKPVPASFNKEKQQKELDAMNAPVTAEAK